ncbi:MAG: gliding motility protein, partial [Myxococcaceae bacterium]|nr:gliding motility protein [Myxococcaceae bacterium]
MRFPFIGLVLVAVVGCRAASQLGEECAMVKRDVDGGRLFLTNGEIKVGAGKDFLSFGSTDCDDLICVRDSDHAPSDGGPLNPNETARGYCSKSCLIGNACPSASAKLDGDPRTRLTCRPLLLDAETL